MTKNVIAGTEYQLLLRCNLSLTLTVEGYLLKISLNWIGYDDITVLSVLSVLSTNISAPHQICAFHY